MEAMVTKRRSEPYIGFLMMTTLLPLGAIGAVVTEKWSFGWGTFLIFQGVFLWVAGLVVWTIEDKRRGGMGGYGD
jgi:hypothetical protein